MFARAKHVLLALAVVLAATPAAAQRVAQNGGTGPNGGVLVECVAGCAGSGGSGGTVDQGTGGASAWLTTISDNAARLLGQVTFSSAQHIICDSGCGSPPATADGTAFTFGSSNVTPVAFVVDDVASTTVSENSYGAARMSGNRILYVDLSKTAANATAIKVDNSAVTQPVSGTFWQATQPVSAASLPLPTGAATAAKQPALGTAGTPSTDVLSVQGVVGGTPIPVSGTFWQATQPVSGTFWQATQPVSLATLPALPAGTNLIGQVGRKNTFDTKVTVTTTTNFTSLGSGSGWSGGAITTTGCYDIRFRLQTKGSSASNTGYVEWFLASSIATETTFDDAASSSADQAFTAANRKNSRPVAGVLMNGTSAVTGSWSALDAFQTLPGAIVPIAINNSGAGLSVTAADHVLAYECVR